jgi:ceramide glucosyltransferase
MHLVRLIFEIVAALLASASLGYCFVCLRSASRFLSERHSPVPLGHSPAVSFLKPLKGAGPELSECLRSHCLLDYPEYEIIFGVSDPADPAAEVVRRLQSEYPQRPIRLVICRENLGTNAKVSNLIQMLPESIYDHLVINDGDIRVEPDYLRRVIAPLGDPAVGLVTCLYSGVASNTLGSRLETLGIATDFAAGVLVARQFEGIHFGLGSTLAFRRRDLAAIGGLEAIADYLADDYELGKRIAGLNREVRLSDVLVETLLPAYTLKEYVDHQLRWARTIRDARPRGYLGMVCTYGLPWALLALILSGASLWAWILLFAVTGMRVAVARMTGENVLHDRRLRPLLWLLPLRDTLALAVWAASLFGHRIIWRGERFILKNGKLARAA